MDLTASPAGASDLEEVQARFEHWRRVLRSDPLAGHVFIFRNKKGTAIKVLVYDGQGFWLCQKRLPRGRFSWWPELADAAARRLAVHELQILIRIQMLRSCFFVIEWTISLIISFMGTDRFMEGAASHVPKICLTNDKDSAYS